MLVYTFNIYIVSIISLEPSSVHALGEGAPAGGDAPGDTGGTMPYLCTLSVQIAVYSSAIITVKIHVLLCSSSGGPSDRVL
jgi:hypothetical protein